MSNRDRFRALAAIGLSLTGILVVSVSPASAETTRAWVVTHNTTRGFAVASDDHLSVAACDTRADNIGVFGRFQLANGTTLDVPDTNGSGGDCGRLSGLNSPVVKYKAISRDGGDSGWLTI
jgi:hypothetical protein